MAYSKKTRSRKILTELTYLFPNPEMVLKYSNNWELLVAVMLSAQTTDIQVNKVTKTLFKKYKTLLDYAQANQGELEKGISSIGLYRSKAKNIIASAKILQETHGGNVPQTMTKLIALPGVGRKTANVVLAEAFGIVEGIAVDTHVTRLSRLFGLTEHTDPRKIEQDLMTLIPKKEWRLFTHRMINYGRTYCPARCRHEECLLYLVK